MHKYEISDESNSGRVLFSKGAMFFGGLLVFLLILGAILLGCVIGKKMMDSPEGKAFYKKMQDG